MAPSEAEVLIELPSLEDLMIGADAGSSGASTNGHHVRAVAPPLPQVGVLGQVSLRAKRVLAEGITPGSWPCTNGETPDQIIRFVARDLLAGGVADVPTIIAASALAGTVPFERLRGLVEDCQREKAREQAALTWLDPPSRGGTDELILRAVVALTRERGPWREFPVRKVVETLTEWVIEQGYPLPLDWPGGPYAGRMLSFRLRRVKKRAAAAGVRWVSERLGGFECEQLGIGSRTRYYQFEPWPVTNCSGAVR